MNKRPTFLILGAGLAGLTAADALVRAGFEVTCLEAQNEVGGLARNFRVRDHFFDLGGHRFFSDLETINVWLRELMKDELLLVERRSRILLNGHYVDYPLKPLSALRGMGLWNSFNILAGYAKTRLQSAGPEVNFEQWVVQRFGRPLYDIYFGPYTRKAWGISPDLISADWAAQRIQLLSLSQAVRKAVFHSGGTPRTLISRFYYPRQGIGRIAALLSERIAKGGGKVLTSHPVTHLAQLPDGRYEAVAGVPETFEADRVISTLPVTHLARLLDVDTTGCNLTYRSLRCVFLLLDKPRVTNDTWIYVHDPKIIFARLHEPKNWSPMMTPGPGTSLCLEIFCDEGDRLWNMPGEEIRGRCVADLANLGLIRPDEVTGADDVCVKDAYPTFLVGYKERLDELKKRFSGFSGLDVLGRTGAFTYTNMDQVIFDALTLANQIIKGR